MKKIKSEKSKPNKLKKFISFILILISIIFMASLYFLNILTTKYLLLIAATILILDIICIFLMTSRKKKKIGYLLSILLSIILALISFYIIKTNNILANFTKNFKTYNYSVVVLKSSNYNELKDIENKTLGYYKTSGEECEKSLQKLEKKVTTENKEYEDVYTLATSLLNNETDAIVIEDSYLNILKENDTQNSDIEGFEDKIKVIYTFKITIKTSDISEDVNVTKEAFNIYISGIDTYGEVSSVSRSDVNMVVTVSPKTQQILLTSIPRDYYVSLHGVSGYKDKLTHAGLYGVDMSVQTIEDLLDIKINYYVKVNFTSLIKIVDAVDGINVYSDYTFTSIDGYNYKKGYNSVNGEQALSFARERKAFQAGDRQRIKDQQAVIDALFRKCTSKSIITKYNSLLNSLEDSFTTNMPTDRITSLIKMQLSKNYDWTITSNSLDGSNSSNYTYSIPNQKAYVMEPDTDSVNEANELITRVMNGEKLESSYTEDDSNASSVTKNSTSSSKSNNSSKTTTNDTSNNSTTKKQTGLKASLIKSSISFTTGDEYIYHGFNATYNDTDITTKASVKYVVQGATYTTSSDLIRYVSNLSPGEYTIAYIITYKNESVTLNQKVTIEESTNIETPDNQNTEENNELEENETQNEENTEIEE